MAAAADLKKYLLTFIGQPVDATVSATDEFMLMTAVNQALTLLLGSALMEDRAELVRAPQNVTLGAVTADSKALTFSGFADWMLGCSVLIGTTWNRFVKSGSSLEWESPYEGDTASNVAATVYQDVVNLSYLIDQPQPPVTLNGQYPITLVPNKAVLEAVRQSVPQVWAPLGLPAYALVRDSLSYQATPATRFEFDKLPLQEYRLKFTARLRAPQITTWEDATTYFLPGARDLDVLYPVARWKLSSYPVFIGDRQEAEKDASTALAGWANFNNKGVQPGILDIHG